MSDVRGGPMSDVRGGPMSTETSIPDGYELKTWSREDGTEARDALLALIDDYTRIESASWHRHDATITVTNFLYNSDIGLIGVTLLLIDADSIAAIVPVAEPAWVSCRAAMDRNGDVWVRGDGSDVFRFPSYLGKSVLKTAAELEREYGPIRPLVDADGKKVLDEDEKTAIRRAVRQGVESEWLRLEEREAVDDVVEKVLNRLHGFGGAR